MRILFFLLFKIKRKKKIKQKSFQNFYEKKHVRKIDSS